MKQFDRTLRSAVDEEEKIRKHKKWMMIAAIIVMLIAIVVIAIIIKKNKEKPYDSYSIIGETELGSGSMVKYEAFLGGFIRYDRDGAAAYRDNGLQQWNVAYNLKSPIISVCDTYTAIADKGSGTLYIVSEEGKVQRHEVVGKIAGVSVSSQGIAAVIATGTDQDHIYIYSGDSDALLVDIMTVTENNGFPLAVAISQDGRKLVTSYTAMDDNALMSWVTFYNFGDVGQNYVDNMVGSYSFPALIPYVKFVSNDKLVICKDDGLVFYKMSEVPKVVATQEFTTEIKSVFSDSVCTGVVLKGELEQSNKLLLFRNDDGKQEFEMAIASDYTDIYTSNEEVVYTNGLEVTIVSDGKKKFQSVFSKNIKRIFRVNDETKYLLIGDSAADEIRLTRGGKQ